MLVGADPLTARYSRFNKSGCITSSAVTSILWLPPSPAVDPASPALEPGASLSTARSNLFVTSHADGSVVLWDKDKEDWNGFVTQPFPPAAAASNFGGGLGAGSQDEGTGAGNGQHGSSWTQRLGSHEGMSVSKVPATDRKGQSMAKYNPVSHWRLSDKAIKGRASHFQHQSRSRG